MAPVYRKTKSQEASENEFGNEANPQFAPADCCASQ
jgi:hypothetical protein